MILSPEFASRFVGVVEPTVFGETRHLKRFLLLFERLALNLSQRLSPVEQAAMRQGRRDLEWLTSEGLVTTLTGLVAEQDPRRDESFLERKQREMDEPTIPGLEGLGPMLGRQLSRVMKPAMRLSGISLRTIAAHLRESDGVDAVAVADAFAKLSVDAPADREYVVKLTLHALPIPSDATAWEDIVDFKRDNESRNRFFRLKGWINRMGREGLSGYEAVDELNGLLHEYESHMNLHRIKATKGTLEVLVTTPAEIAEDLVKLKIGKLAKAPFDISRQRTILLEAERNAPGREIAYVVSARERFS